MKFTEALKSKEAHGSFAKRLLNDNPISWKEEANYPATFLWSSTGVSVTLIKYVIEPISHALANPEIISPLAQNRIELFAGLALGFATGYLLTFSQFTREQNKELYSSSQSI